MKVEEWKQPHTAPTLHIDSHHPLASLVPAAFNWYPPNVETCGEMQNAFGFGLFL